MQKDSNTNNPQNSDQAVEVIRGKLDNLYAQEPPAVEEIEEIEHHHGHMSKHQRYMHELSLSQRSLAEIQTAWHKYYSELPDKEKHEVWQEFYNERQKSKPKAKTHESPEEPTHDAAKKTRPKGATHPPDKPEDIREELLSRVSKQTSRKKHHAKALGFGLTMGVLTIFILLFSFFNERFITPFIKPSYNISGTPIITEPGTSGKAGPDPKIIIPKINLEAPVVYDEKSIEEASVQNALERGVLHYATTPNPGEVGNAVIFGHSSSNIFNSGKYKFAFLLLKSLEKDDTFILEKGGQRYVYKVYDKYVTSPKDLSVLKKNNRKATVTLITCDPPGTSTNRLIVIGEQIFPSPDNNKPSTAIATNETPQQLASNPPSLWSRLWNWL